MNAYTPVLPERLVACQRCALAIGLVALAVLAVGGFFDPDQFLRAYLAAYLYFFGIAMGSMALVMVYHVTGGAWGFLIRRILEASMRTLPLVAIGLVPIALGVHRLYPWARPEVVETNQLVRSQQIYMNVPFVYGRAALFFALWLTIAGLLSWWSRAQDRNDDPRLALRLDGLSGVGLVIYGITMHFTAIDWLMSLQPAFHSTIFGPLVVSGQILSGHAFALVVLAILSRQAPLAEIVSPKALNDLGNLLLAFVVVWTYMVWFQYMLIWIANLPLDVVWYKPRLTNGWQWVTLSLLLFHFALPFVLLLFRAVKQNLPLVMSICCLVLLMQLVFMYYQVLPAFDAPALAEHWMDFIAPLALGGLWLAFFVSRLRARPLLPAHDFNKDSAVHLRRSDEHELAWEESLRQ
jgi:hypothetical protein